MTDYYTRKLAADRLRQVYQLAPPRIQQYLEAEICFVLGHLRWTDSVLELGCGFGRVLERLASKARLAVGIDTSDASLTDAASLIRTHPNIRLAQMSAASLGIADHTFDRVVCIQNGISAFHLDPLSWIREAIRVTRPDGLILISSYSDKLWDERLNWFRIQSGAGLIGELDRSATGNGEIVSTDGFHATTHSPERFTEIVRPLGLQFQLAEVDDSSLFCVIRV